MDSCSEVGVSFNQPAPYDKGRNDNQGVTRDAQP